jgi:hypothetical protein
MAPRRQPRSQVVFDLTSEISTRRDQHSVLAQGREEQFLVDATAIAWALAVPLLFAAATVTATNWCLPSFIYGLLHGRRTGELVVDRPTRHNTTQHDTT